MGVVKFLAIKNRNADRKNQLLSEAGENPLKDAASRRRGTVFVFKDGPQLAGSNTHKHRNKYLQQAKSTDGSMSEEPLLTSNQVELINYLEKLSELNASIQVLRPKSKSNLANSSSPDGTQRVNSGKSNFLLGSRPGLEGSSKNHLPNREPSRSMAATDILNKGNGPETMPEPSRLEVLEKNLTLLVEEIIDLMEKDEHLKKLFDTLGFEGPEDKKQVVRVLMFRCVNCSAISTTNLVE